MYFHTVKPVQTTNSIRRPKLSPPKQIPVQLSRQDDHLPNATSNHFCLLTKKNLSKTTTTKLYSAKKWETSIRQQCIKNKRLSDLYALLLLYNVKFV